MTPIDAPPPRAQTRFVGHDAAVQRLSHAVDSGRVPHAWIFNGPRGVGKATLAYRFARHLLCPPWAAAPEPEDAGPSLFGEPSPAAAQAAPRVFGEVAPDDPAARRIAAGSHGDVKLVERPFDEARGRFKAELPVDLVRAIPPFLRLTSSEGGWRFVIVDDADTMNIAAQNALLKILEEPPDRSVLVLVTQNLGRLLPTIRSRCRLLGFGALPEAIVAEVLSFVAPDAEPRERALAAALADGSVARALERLGPEAAEALLRVQGLVTGFAPGGDPKADPLATHYLAREISLASADAAYRHFTDLLLWWLSRLVRAAARDEAPTALSEMDAAACSAVLRRVPTVQALSDLYLETREILARTEAANLDRRQALLALHRLYRHAIPLDHSGQSA